MAWGGGTNSIPLITVRSNLDVLNTIIEDSSFTDVIEVLDGTLKLYGRTEIKANDDQNFISAKGTSKVSVMSSDVKLTGGLFLADNANVNLGSGNLYLSKEIVIEGTKVTINTDGCKIEVLKPAIKKQPVSISVVPYGAITTLSVKTESENDETLQYQWYDNDNNPIEGAITCELECGPYTEKGIHYFYCVVNRKLHVGNQEFVSDDTRSDSSTVAYTGLPTVYINTPDGVPITSKEEWLPDATIDISGTLNDDWNFDGVNTYVKGRGNSTWIQPKKPYAIKLYEGKKVLGMPKGKRWVLIANYLDNSYMRNSIAFYISKTLEAGYTVKGEFVDLVINGNYQGLYWLGEAIKVDNKRVNIDEDYDYLIEMDVYYDEQWKFKSSIRNLPYMIKNDDSMEPEEVGNDRLAALHSAINDIESLLYPDGVGSSTPPNENYVTRVDVDSWAKFWMINEIMDNGELNHPKSCYFTYTVSDGVLKAGPVWDFDWSSLYQQNDCTVQDSLYYDALFKSDSFKNRIKELWDEYSNQLEIEDEIEQIRTQIYIAQQIDNLKWGVHSDPSGIIRDGFGEYVDFLKETITQKKSIVNETISQL